MGAKEEAQGTSGKPQKTLHKSRPVEHLAAAGSAKLAGSLNASTVVVNPISPSSSSSKEDAAAPRNDATHSSKWQRSRRGEENTEVGDMLSPGVDRETSAGPKRNAQPSASSSKTLQRRQKVSTPAPLEGLEPKSHASTLDQARSAKAEVPMLATAAHPASPGTGRDMAARPKPVVVLRRGEQSGAMCSNESEQRCLMGLMGINEAEKAGPATSLRSAGPRLRSASPFGIELDADLSAELHAERVEPHTDPQTPPHREPLIELHAEQQAEPHTGPLTEPQRIQTPQDLRQSPTQGLGSVSVSSAGGAAASTSTPMRSHEVPVNTASKPRSGRPGPLVGWKPSLRASPANSVTNSGIDASVLPTSPSSKSVATAPAMSRTVPLPARRSFYNMREAPSSDS